MTTDSDGRSLKPWTKVRDEMIINCEGYINPIQAAKEGFNAGRTDTLERMKKVREALEIAEQQLAGVSLCLKTHGNNLNTIYLIGYYEKCANQASEAISILEKELSDG